MLAPRHVPSPHLPQLCVKQQLRPRTFCLIRLDPAQRLALGSGLQSKSPASQEVLPGGSHCRAAWHELSLWVFLFLTHFKVLVIDIAGILVASDQEFTGRLSESGFSLPVSFNSSD